MARSRSDRFSLADLVALVLMCGLIAALVRSTVGPEQVAVLVLSFIVLTVWATLRAKRTGPLCEECGRRFIQPKKASPPLKCPQCGQLQTAHLRSLKRMTRIFWGLVLLLPFFMAAALSSGIDPTHSAPDGTRLAVLFIATGGMLLTLLSAMIVGAYRYIQERPKERMCETCDGVIPAHPAGSLICPACQSRKLSSDEAKKAQTKNLWIGLLVWVVLGCVLLAIIDQGSPTGGCRLAPGPLPGRCPDGDRRGVHRDASGSVRDSRPGIPPAPERTGHPREGPELRRRTR